MPIYVYPATLKNCHVILFVGKKPPISWLLTMLSGDIELNPGPFNNLGIMMLNAKVLNLSILKGTNYYNLSSHL
jgi:hypothetical protein